MSAGEPDGQLLTLLRRGNANETGEAFVSLVAAGKSDAVLAAMTAYYKECASQGALREKACIPF